MQQARQGLLDAAADAASVVGMDETRYPREGAANWVWAAVRPKLVVFNILPSRARYVAKEMIGEKPRALLVSDRYVVYKLGGCAAAPGVLGAGYVLFRWREQGRPAAAYQPL